jgi:diguanylate cyclase (GGDEF)-like protein/PAS domain S-box-containing protein
MNMESADSMIQDRIQYLRENTDFVSAVFDSLIGYAIIAADFDGNIIACNEGAHQIYGYTPEEVIGRQSIDTFLPKEFIAKGRLQQVVSDLLETGRSSFEGETVRKDGSRFPAHLLFTLTKDKSGQTVGFVEIVQELTLQKKAEALIKESEARLRRIIESNADSMLIVDGDGIICFANSATETLFVRPAKELLGAYFGFPTASGERTEIEIVRPVAYGTAVAEMRITDIEWQGQKAYLATLRDVTERKIIEEKLTFLSVRDPLTGLYNRFFFEAEMRRFGGGRFDPVGIAMCDVDGLKIINDTLGHQAGDEFLLTVSKILREAFRESDVVARVGGDEFAILLPNTSLADVEMISGRLEGCIERFNKDHRTIPVSLSIGYAVKIGPSPDMSEVYRQSDDNMYNNKRNKCEAARSNILQYFVKAGIEKEDGYHG